MALAPSLFVVDGLDTFLSGMILRAVGPVAVTVCLSLYILDFIAKKDLSRSAPMRLLYSAAAWCTGPFLGLWPGAQVGREAPHLLSAAVAVLVLTSFLFLRFTLGKAWGG